MIIIDESLDYNTSADNRSIVFNLKVKCESSCVEFLTTVRTVNYKNIASDGLEYSLIFNITTIFEGDADFTFSTSSSIGLGQYIADKGFFGGINDTIQLTTDKQWQNKLYGPTGSSIHEVGHRIGFRHQANSTNNQMSYSHAKQQFNGNDTKRLINGYLKRGVEKVDWISRDDHIYR